MSYIVVYAMVSKALKISMDRYNCINEFIAYHLLVLYGGLSTACLDSTQ